MQRVTKAQVTVADQTISSIDQGLLILLGVFKEDTLEQVNWLVDKIANLRIFPDSHGKMNLSVKQIDGKLLVVSQFTLCASASSGRRPDFFAAAEPRKAEELYEACILRFAEEHKLVVQKGAFGEKMQVTLVNNGPVTIIIDTP